MIVGMADLILVTGAAGFIGSRVVARLLDKGFRNVRCFARMSSDVRDLERLASGRAARHIEILRGDLLSRDACESAMRDVAVVYHLAAGTRNKSFSDAFRNSVDTTRNLLDASLVQGRLKRFVNVSSLAVYSNRDKSRSGVLDESSSIETNPERRGEAYCYAKVKQDELVISYGTKYGVPYVILRPGAVYGPGRAAISGRVGKEALGIFIHFGGSNPIPLTYVDNCAEAIVLAGIKEDLDGEVLNIIDDDLPTSREFLRLYKQHVRSFVSVPLPRPSSYVLCWLWETLSRWSAGRLRPVFTRSAWHAYWKGSRYENQKAKRLLGWAPEIPTAEGLKQYFEHCRAGSI